MSQKIVWSAIIIVVLLLLGIIQVLRVNQPRPSDEVTTEPLYTSKGPLVNGVVPIQAGEFFSLRLNLNRRSKLSGTFRTASLKSSVSALLIDEKHLEPWKSRSDHPVVARTGYVPGGKINQVLEPGTYLLLIDNREGVEIQTVNVDFNLE